MGYLDSGLFFAAIILLPALAWWRFGLNGVTAFWMAYVVTRPLGASFSDWVSKPQSISGLNFGNGRTAIAIAVVVLGLVSYLAVARPDIQRSADATADDQRSPRSTPEYASGALELEVE